jgi:hypothetical protein
VSTLYGGGGGGRVPLQRRGPATPRSGRGARPPLRPHPARVRRPRRVSAGAAQAGGRPRARGAPGEICPGGEALGRVLTEPALGEARAQGADAPLLRTPRRKVRHGCNEPAPQPARRGALETLRPAPRVSSAGPRSLGVERPGSRTSARQRACLLASSSHRRQIARAAARARRARSDATRCLRCTPAGGAGVSD